MKILAMPILVLVVAGIGSHSINAEAGKRGKSRSGGSESSSSASSTLNAYGLNTTHTIQRHRHMNRQEVKHCLEITDAANALERQLNVYPVDEHSESSINIYNEKVAQYNSKLQDFDANCADRTFDDKDVISAQAELQASR